MLERPLPKALHHHSQPDPRRALVVPQCDTEQNNSDGAVCNEEGLRAFIGQEAHHRREVIPLQRERVDHPSCGEQRPDKSPNRSGFEPPLLYEVQLEDDGEDGAEIVEGPPEFLWPREPAAAPRARGGGAEALGLLREKVRLQGALDRAAYALEQRASAMGTPGGSAPPPPAGQRAPPPPPPGPVHL